MDYKDHAAGLKGNNFWFYRKTEFIGILIERLKLNKNIKILNVGAGTGNDIEMLNKFGKVVVLDIDPKALNLIPDGQVEEKIIGDVCCLNLPHNSFDMVVAFDVLEHIKDDDLAVDQIKHFLKPDGIFIFTVPAYSFLFSSHDKYLGHYRRYNKKDLISLFQKFEKIELGNWFFFLFPIISLHRLINKNRKYKEIKIPKIIDFIWNNIILKNENLLFKFGLRYPWGSTFYGIYKKSN